MIKQIKSFRDNYNSENVRNIFKHNRTKCYVVIPLGFIFNLVFKTQVQKIQL